MLRLLFCLMAVLGLSTASIASLSPNDVVVVYNASTTQDGYDWSISKSVADYYCSARGIPLANEVGVVWPRSYESIIPEEFYNDIATPLRTFLSSRPGFSLNDPGSDPTKCIVLCYGIPIHISGADRASGLDSALSLLFNTTPWGREPIGNYPNVYGNKVENPYYDSHADPAQRTKPADFGEFRASTYNHTTETAPNFTIVRFLDSSHALAAGRRGMLYRGTLSGSDWTWEAIIDASKDFLGHDITDISVLDSSHASISTAYGAVIQTSNGGVSWQRIRNAECPYFDTQPTSSVSLSSSDCWVVGKWGDTQVHTSSPYYVFKYPDNKWSNLPTGFHPAGIAAQDTTHVWVSGNSGIYFSGDNGNNWTQVWNTCAVGDIWVRNNVGWAVAANGQILHYDGTSWSQASGALTTKQSDNLSNILLTVASKHAIFQSSPRQYGVC